jgi:hypothetical protein
MLAAGIPAWIDDKPAIAHNKIIIDDHLTVNGSFNYPAAAEKRTAENVTCTGSWRLLPNSRRIGSAGSRQQHLCDRDLRGERNDPENP